MLIPVSLPLAPLSTTAIGGDNGTPIHTQASPTSTRSFTPPDGAGDPPCCAAALLYHRDERPFETLARLGRALSSCPILPSGSPIEVADPCTDAALPAAVATVDSLLTASMTRGRNARQVPDSSAAAA